MTRNPHLAAISAVAISIFAASASPQQACPLTVIGTANVAAVRDGRALVLKDGHELRLAAIEVPSSNRATLLNLAAGRVLRLEKLGSDHDHYGRLVAFVFAGDSKQSVPQALPMQGAAQVPAPVGDIARADALLVAGRTAHAGRRGLWGNPNFAPLPAKNRTRLKEERDHFALVEGKILSVCESRETIYMNFGRRWIEGFGIVIQRRFQRAFTAAGVELKQLAERRIWARSWIEARRSPIIGADGSEQIGVADDSMMQSQGART